MKPHKWAKEIKAWADGEIIECQYQGDDFWHEADAEIAPVFAERHKYRIKPQPKEPQYLYVFRTSNNGQTEYKLWHDEDTGGAYIGKIKLEQDDAN